MTIGTPFNPEVPPGAPNFGEMVCTFEDGGIFRTKCTAEDKDYHDDMTLEANGEIKIVQRCGGVECTSYYTKV